MFDVCFFFFNKGHVYKDTGHYVFAMFYIIISFFANASVYQKKKESIVILKEQQQKCKNAVKKMQPWEMCSYIRYNCQYLKK